MIKNESAITLIVLIITIIVLTLIATIGINLAINEDGIIKRTQTSKDTYYNSQINEEKMISQYEDEIDIASDRTTSDEVKKLKKTIEELQEQISALTVKTTNYSTDERVVGTWINNKPLYERTAYLEGDNLKTKFSSDGYQYMIYTIFPNNETMHNINVRAYRGSVKIYLKNEERSISIDLGKHCWPAEGYGSNYGVDIVPYYEKSGLCAIVAYISNTFYNYSNAIPKEICCTIQYTKNNE